MPYTGGKRLPVDPVGGMVGWHSLILGSVSNIPGGAHRTAAPRRHTPGARLTCRGGAGARTPQGAILAAQQMVLKLLTSWPSLHRCKHADVGPGRRPRHSPGVWAGNNYASECIGEIARRPARLLLQRAIAKRVVELPWLSVAVTTTCEHQDRTRAMAVRT
jgi:hypothetical protein